MLAGVLDPESKVLWEDREVSTGQDEGELLELLVREVGEARAARPDAAAVGLGIPATIDRERGVAVSAVNLPIADLPIRDAVAERTGLPVFVDNDANVAALAEYLYGAARGARNAVMLTIGTGIGGGLILDGEVYRGSTGAGAELGHTVIDMTARAARGTARRAAASRRSPPGPRSAARVAPPPSASPAPPWGSWRRRARRSTAGQ